MRFDTFSTNGKFLMLALDHRESFRKLMNPGDPEAVSDEEIITLKSSIIDSVIDQASGVLIDPEWGLKAYSHRTKPFLLPVEKSGYRAELGERITDLQYSVDQLIDWGAAGAKLLVYFNPHAKSANRQLATAKTVLDDCKARNFPLFIEIVTYDVGSHTGGVVLRAFIEQKIIPDVFKLEYPGDTVSCETITKLLGATPWILLTRGDSFDVFRSNLTDAIKGGARGFLAGRALWQEACGLSGEDRQRFLRGTLPERFRTIAEIARESV